MITLYQLQKTLEQMVKDGVPLSAHVLVGTAINGDIQHRYSWELHFGKIPKGLSVLHKCDNPSCVNPDHLFLGTQKTNMNDCSLKGRIQKGEDHCRAVLTENCVREIRAKYKFRKYTRKMLADEYSISVWTVDQVIHRETWKEVM